MRFAKSSLIAFMVLGAPEAAWAAGAYIVDDAEIVEPGKIQSESWYAYGGHNTDFGTVNLADQLLPKTEFTLQETHAFLPGADNAVLGQAKYVWYESRDKGIAAAIVAGVNYTAFRNRTSSPFIYVPVSLYHTPDWETDVNLGWFYENPASRHYVTWGVKETCKIAPVVWLEGDLFGFSAETPGLQIGPHFMVNDSLEFDLIFGRNVYGLEENSGTAGMTVRF